MEWLEQLLAKDFLRPQDTFVPAGGLESVDEALENMRNGAFPGKRIVVPVGNTEQSRFLAAESIAVSRSDIENFQYADRLNADPSRIKFA